MLQAAVINSIWLTAGAITSAVRHVLWECGCLPARSRVYAHGGFVIGTWTWPALSSGAGASVDLERYSWADHQHVCSHFSCTLHCAQTLCTVTSQFISNGQKSGTYVCHQNLGTWSVHIFHHVTSVCLRLIDSFQCLHVQTDTLAQARTDSTENSCQQGKPAKLTDLVLCGQSVTLIICPIAIAWL